MVSTPEYDVRVDLDVMVEMRDGTELATDVFRPVDPATGDPLSEPVPALLDRTPYDKRSNLQRHGEWFAERGYVVAVQDVRGRFGSGGEFYIFANEAEDGYDTVEWVAERPYCDGQVGTIGSSYGAWVQSALATQDPPHLEAMFVNQGAANAWDATFRHNGAFELRWLCWAFVLGGGFAKRAFDAPEIQAHLANTDTRDLLANGPVERGNTPLRHLPEYEEWLFDAMTSDGSADLWASPGLNFEAHYDESADVPTVYAGGWYDSYTKATCDNFEALAARKESDHYLVVGPWTHGWEAYPLPSWRTPHAGEVAFGPEATRDYQAMRLRFFDHYLKGEGTWADQPTVQYWRMGTGDGHRTGRGRLFHGGEWRHAEEWPLPGTEFTPYYAHPDGTLSPERPTAEESATTYRFDPTDPVPTVGGNCSSYHAFEQTDATLLEYPIAERKRLDITGSGGYDQRTRPETFGADPPYGPLAERDDVLVFRTPPLEEAVEITGPITVRVSAETDAADTDFTAKLLDEYPPSADFPNGFALNLSDSICRARYRGYRTDPDFVDPGTVYEFVMEPYPTANVFGPGHSIRLDISSSNFPRYDVNRNTGGPLYGGRDYEVARNTVHHSRTHPTHVELPVRPTDGA
ncbi:CocE/NonD family hydrolase [Halomarina ordinaria]|uniref:CocE/NonD family hydrolase n=1 Tax=Halomarina ordinaria TaxID=3033939 RepID=A0ABD5UC20_9EURY|nr:CocE/NonD family hydrolase [Halomarina sp. PSRA2]